MPVHTGAVQRRRPRTSVPAVRTSNSMTPTPHSETAGILVPGAQVQSGWQFPGHFASSPPSHCSVPSRMPLPHTCGSQASGIPSPSASSGFEIQVEWFPRPPWETNASSASTFGTHLTIVPAPLKAPLASRPPGKLSEVPSVAPSVFPSQSWSMPTPAPKSVIAKSLRVVPPGPPSRTQELGWPGRFASSRS